MSDPQQQELVSMREIGEITRSIKDLDSQVARLDDKFDEANMAIGGLEKQIIRQNGRPAKPEPMSGHLTRDELWKLLGTANAPHVRLAVILMISTGARNEAAMQLTWDRVNFERRTIQLRDPFDKTRRKGRATVLMNDTLFAGLETARKGAMTSFVMNGRDVLSGP